MMSNPPLTTVNYQAYYAEHGLVKTISWFDDFVNYWTTGIVHPSYSFAHIVLEDYNIYDNHIDFCLGEVNNYLFWKFNDLDTEYADPYANEPWESWQYWALVEGSEMVVDFLNWLLTIDEDERETEIDKYYELL